MPQCLDRWRRGGEVSVDVKATCQDSDQFYSLTYVFFPRAGEPLLLGGNFNSSQLSDGVKWKVPAGHRCGFQILTTGATAIDTEIKFNGVLAACNPAAHCQGACKAPGSAGIAGDWTLSAVRTGG